MDITYAPIPCMCKGIVKWKIKETENYDVDIYQSPLGKLNGSVAASAIFQPGLNDNYKQGDFVYVLIYFTFGGHKSEFIKVQPGSKYWILGLFNEKSIANIKVEEPLSETSNDRLTFLNQTGSGLVISDNGESSLVSGPLFRSVKSDGFGVNKNCVMDYGQNFWRMISHSDPGLSREHFGMFGGVDDDDASARTSETDYNIIYRRFVTQTRAIDKWVSTCEGTHNPWVGANVDSEDIAAGKEVLCTKIINNGESRVTIEYGEPGDSFVNLRVDDVIKQEQVLNGVAPGATPATVGNRFSLNISDKGAVNLSASGSAKSQNNTVGFSLTISENGDLNIYAQGKITFSHSAADVENNSIVIDPEAGIDIKSKKGLRFNGLNLVTKKFLDWMNKNKQALCQVTAIGGPAPIHPAALPEFSSGLTKMSEQDGFLTINSGTAKSGKNDITDTFMTT